MKKTKSRFELKKTRGIYPGRFKIKFRVAADLARIYGMAYFLKKILPWHLHRQYEVFFHQLENIAPAIAGPGEPPLRLARATEKDFRNIMNLRPGYYTPDQLAARLALGHICFLGWSGDQPVHIRWVFTSSIFVPYIKRRLALAPGEVYIDEGFTAPSFRGQGLFALAGNLLRQELKKMGYRYYTCAIASWHRIRLAVAEKNGLCRAGRIRYWNFPWSSRVELSGSVRDLGLGKVVIDVRP